jgi:DNA-binding response OmpR family regulator
MARVLIVEDEPAIRHLLDDFFTSEGFDTLLACSGTSAIALASAVQPDVILLDMMLPGADGVTATRLLRGHRLTRDIPIIAMSANTQVLERVVAELPVNEAIAKPFDLDILLNVVWAHVDVTRQVA